MIDIHCHLLAAIDDGPPGLAESVEMARMAAADGIRTIVASPHFSYGRPPGIPEIDLAMLSLRERLREDAVQVDLLRGADIRLTYELLEGIKKGDLPTINGSRYFLLELPEIIPPNLDNFLHSVNIRGLVPVITHPERNYTFLSAPRKVFGLRDGGALIQVTAMSITGEFGAQVQGLSDMLLQKGLVDFVATDAHGAVQRKPVLSKAFKTVTRRLGAAAANRIFFENPQAVIENEEIIVRSKA